METIHKYVERLFKDVPKSAEKEMVKQEIIDNLEEKIKDLIEQGVDRETAVQLAISEFGNINELKMELTKTQQELKKNTAKLNLVFSILGSILIISMLVFTNLYYTPDVIWFVYPTFAVLWWPLSMFYYWLRKR
jgi:hypothetical protein